MTDSSAPKSLWADVAARLVGHILPVTYFLVTVSFFLKTYDSAQVKITLTQIGCSLTVVLWAVQLILERRWPVSRADLPLAAPFLALLGSGIFSMATSSFPSGSLEEGFRRVIYALMGLVALLEFRGRDRHRRLLRWLLAAFVVVVGYGVLQYLDTRLFSPQGPGLDPFVWRQAFGHRVFSTFGNPNFYGNFLVIITPIILSIYLRSGGGFFRPYVLLGFLVPVVILSDKLFLGGFGGVDASSRWMVGAALLAFLGASAFTVFFRAVSGTAAGMLLFFGALFVTLYSTETKGAWIGFLGALIGTTILAGLFLSGQDGRRVTRRLLIAAAVTGVLGFGVVGYYARQRIQSVSFRVFTWISTWEMIRENPVLGTGIGSFKWAYPAYRRPEIILLEGKSNTETDHAEQEYLELWYDEGAVGLGFFLFLILMTSVMGLKGLGRLTVPSSGSFDKERVHAVVAYLGAWWGALLHWCMDVSVRFVSSGIYSLFLPGMVLALLRRDTLEEHQDSPVDWDRNIRGAVALFWTAIFVALPQIYETAPLLSQVWKPLLIGFLLWVLGEVLEAGLSSPEKTPFSVPARPPVAPLPALAVVGLLVFYALGPLQKAFRHFSADLHHNIAIYFSKSGLWSTGPEFQGLQDRLPPEMREEYRKVGGALQHYEKVVSLNPQFPMALYFIGNVHNDWGSSFLARASEARRRGDESSVASFVEQAERRWESAMDTYRRVKAFAPNYVQTHHQVGTLQMKRMELYEFLGRPEDARRSGDEALLEFEKYRKLDPVFPQNYYYMASIHSRREDWDRAEETLRGALAYNTRNVVNRIYTERNVETQSHLARLLLTRLEKTRRAGRLDLSGSTADRARAAFEAVLAEAVSLSDGPAKKRFMADAQQGLLLLSAGK